MNRACSFGEDPEAYDRFRPRYPDPLYDELLRDGGVVDVLDIGCGTGLAGAPLVDRGCRVVGVEPDQRMGALAARRGIEVEQATFEDWDPRGRRFQLAVAGTSWHWVDAAVGEPKVLSVLEPGRRFAAFWNVPRYPADIASIFDDVYARHAPHLRDSVALGSEHDVPFDAIYEADRTQSLDDWIEELVTHSGHRTADPTTVATIVDELRSRLPDPVPQTMRTRVTFMVAPGT